MASDAESDDDAEPDVPDATFLWEQPMQRAAMGIMYANLFMISFCWKNGMNSSLF